MTVTQVRLDTIMHATEDHAKILGALSTMLGVPDIFSTKRIDGHYSNSIVTASATIRGKQARVLLGRFGNELPKDQIVHLLETMHTRVKDSVIYIRISKQEMVLGRILLQERDAVRMRISVQVHGKTPGSVLTNLMGIESREG